MRVPLLSLLFVLPAIDLTPTTIRAAAEIEAPGKATLETVALTSEGLDHAALGRALALRLPETAQLQVDEVCGGGCVHVRVRAVATPAASVTIEAFLDDGRVFTRRMPADGEEVERRVATLLAHLLTSITAGEPVADDAGPAEAPTEPEPELASPRTEDVAAQELAIAQPCVEATRADEAQANASPPTPSPTLPMYELGPAFGLVTVMGLGPPRALAGKVGGGTLVDLELRSPTGLLLGASGRVLEAGESGYRLTRLRFAFAVGYGLRRGLFELRTLAAVSVEPWWVLERADGARASFGQPLLGGALIVAPGVQAALSDRLRVHAGLRASASATAPPAGAGTILATDRAGNALFRLGGFELSVLAEIGARWGIAPRGRRR